MKILLVKRWEFDMVWNKIRPENLKQIPGLYTPHYWLAGANTVVMVEEEVKIGKYRHTGSVWNDPCLASMLNQSLNWDVEPVHPVEG